MGLEAAELVARGVRSSLVDSGRREMAMKRYFVAILAAYAASMTLIASNRAAEAWLYRRGFNAVYRGKHGRPSDYPDLMALVADFGMILTPLERWSLVLADLRSLVTVPAIILFLLVGLGAAAWTRKPSRTHPAEED